MHFEKGDIVLGKCRNQKPWPAKIVCFRGYSENNTEIYKVSFFGSKTWANLESCNLDYLGKKKAQRVNELRKSEKNFKKSVQMAMRKLQAIEN